MFKENNNFEKFESKVWLSSPTMHGPEIEYVKEAYETNWMSTVGKNINEAVLFLKDDASENRNIKSALEREVKE